ncbi:hypothetical protein LIPSTDRAFT_217015 [Lipomyces starkeyi NRRL Y-11557]|uniref:Uncharacterized protein n=1 Tax=Lipomyces starkeyi NRRL Y-11557 TaxID=675824 RepID=A0A1E3QDN0_LIPST|nr:hypothetical protein LIPSTDRAFT_217015 [Lipomyces starkeyi NRRL Y-11557]
MPISGGSILPAIWQARRQGSAHSYPPRHASSCARICIERIYRKEHPFGHGVGNYTIFGGPRLRRRVHLVCKLLCGSS